MSASVDEDWFEHEELKSFIPAAYDIHVPYSRRRTKVTLLVSETVDKYKKR